MYSFCKNSELTFDVNENDTDKNVILKKVSDTPITFTLQGSGTESDPYVIKTWKHWKRS